MNFFNRRVGWSLLLGAMLPLGWVAARGVWAQALPSGAQSQPDFFAPSALEARRKWWKNTSPYEREMARLDVESDSKLSRAQKQRLLKEMPLLPPSAQQKHRWNALPFVEKLRQRHSALGESRFSVSQKARLLKWMPLPLPGADWQVAAREKSNVNWVPAAPDQNAPLVRIEIGEAPANLSWSSTMRGDIRPDPLRGEQSGIDTQSNPGGISRAGALPEKTQIRPPQVPHNQAATLLDTKFLVRVVGGAMNTRSEGFPGFRRDLNWSVSRAWVRPNAQSAWRAFERKVEVEYAPQFEDRFSLLDPDLQVRAADDGADRLYEVALRAYGGGHWRYELVGTSGFDWFMPPGTKDVPRIEARFLVEAHAPVYGDTSKPAPWPRTRFDVFPPAGLLKELQYGPTRNGPWKRAPLWGEVGFPIRAAQADALWLRVVPRDSKRPWPRDPHDSPKWKGTFGISDLHLNAHRQPEHFVDVFADPSRSINRQRQLQTKPSASSTNVFEIDRPKFKDAQGSEKTWWRSSRNNSDLLRVSVSAGNTLSTAIRIVPSPKPPGSKPADSESSNSGPRGMDLYIDNATNTAMKGQPEGAEFTVGGRRDPAKQPKVRIVVNNSNGNYADGVRVRFRLEKKGFGTFDNGQTSIEVKSDEGYARTPFNPPSVAGNNVLWAEVLDTTGAVAWKEAKHLKFNALKLQVHYGQWRPVDERDDEWTRAIYVLANSDSRFSGGYEGAGVDVKLKLVPPPGEKLDARISGLQGGTNATVANERSDGAEPFTAQQFFRYNPNRDATRQLDAYIVEAQFARAAGAKK